MYKLTDIRAIHLEVTSRCQAKCPMCARRMNGGPLNPFMGLDEISIDKFMEWFDVDFIKQLNQIYHLSTYDIRFVSKNKCVIV